MRLLLILVLALAALAAPAAAKPVAAGPGEPAAPDSKPVEPATIAPAAEPGKPAGEAAAPPARQLREALGRIGLDAAGVPPWAWPPLALLAFALLRLLFRRGGRDDLMGPPRPARYRNLPRY